MATLKNLGIAYAAGAGLLVAYNVRWRHLYSFLVGGEPKKLPLVKVEGTSKTKKSIPVVLLHGMWHDASWFHELQVTLQKAGYSSCAIDLLPGERFLLGFSQKEIVASFKVG